MTVVDVFERIGIDGAAGRAAVLVVLLLSLVQISPVRLDPWDRIFAWFGRKLNEDVDIEIRDLKKPLDTEMIIYGRLPVMVSDQCVIRQSAGKCNCQIPGQLSDRTGSVFPVVKDFGCRNVIYNAHKLFLADKRSDLLSAGLWGLRLMFTTESARECVEVAKSYLGLNDYQPNMLTRGLYYRGVE